MKRNSIEITWPRSSRRLAAALLAAGCLLAACSDDPAAEAQGRPLPRGEYPLSLSAAVAPAVRSTADNAWAGGEQVAVQAVSGSAADWSAAETKTYAAAADGTLSAADPADAFWWTRSDERKSVRAWYCGDGSTAAGEANAASLPSRWSVQADQSEADAGYGRSDLLFAPAVSKRFTGGAVPLSFYHQTAKVIVNIRNAGYVTDAAQILSVRIGNGNIALSGDYEAPEQAATAGNWSPGTPDGTITPRRLAEPTDAAKYVASYAALLIPQTMDGKRLVAVETDLGTMYYIAAAGDAQLGSGRVHTYNITVKADRLEVEVVGGGTWTDGGSEPVTSIEVKHYTASDLKIGDYFYDDGSTSDGGLRKLYADGRQQVEAQKPAPVLTNPVTQAPRSVIGIVFQTDPARIGQAEKAAGYTHGLVVAARAPTAGYRWYTDRNGQYTRDETGIGIPNISGEDDIALFLAMDGDIEGYKYNRAIRDQRAADFRAGYYPAFEAVVDFEGEVPAPAATTGWYLPSSGQWFDILRSLGGAVLNSDEMVPTPITGQLLWICGVRVLEKMNAALEHLAPEDKTAFGDGWNYWTSSVSSASYARVVRVAAPNSVSCDPRIKNAGEGLRFVLAF